MATEKDVDVRILKLARAKLSNRRNWCRGSLAEDKHGDGVDPIDPEAKTFCALGALTRATWELTARSGQKISLEKAERVGDCIADQLCEGGAVEIVNINDDHRYGRRDIIALFDKKIAQLEDKEKV